MAITITTNTLSTNAKYINYSASTAAADAKDLLLAIANALVAMPAPNQWTRVDTAGSTAVLNANDDGTVVLRRQCEDFADSGHYQFLGISLSSDGSAYTMKLTHCAAWGSLGSATGYSGVAKSPDDTFSFADGLRIPAGLVNYAASGTIWLFNENFGTYFCFTGTGITQGYENSFYVGEYKKDFGENAPTGEYIHNGVAINTRYWFKGTGVGVNLFPTYSSYGYWPMVSNYGQYYNYGGGTGMAWRDNGPGSYMYGHTYYATHYSRHGNEYRSQFALTEYPIINDTETGDSNRRKKGFTKSSSEISSPAAWDHTWQIGTSTRVHMGWMGWVGHTHRGNACSIISHWDQKDAASVQNYGGDGNSSTSEGGPGLFSNAMNKYRQSFRTLGINQGTPVIGSTAIAVYEPTLSCGMLNAQKGAGYFTPGQTTSTSTSYTAPYQQKYWKVDDYDGTKIKFSLLGRLKNFRFSCGHGDMEFEFLDTGTFPIDASGNFDPSGTSTDFWAIPFGNHSLKAGATLWVKK